ncbi:MULTISPECIES: right-handed parallel beta-helix repeat-containing protein [Sphingobacterium]|uniref:right-handed parallel beta-helix repeat-containing protein n=1 Tax=Sphingobacterium TaxID=28453 RepID=UPI00257D55BB|nr:MULTISPECIES: right-handed parallel beta-helix repeat-containing protein [Sphingobacterium]
MANQFLVKETMAAMRGLSATEITGLQTGTYEGIQLLGYYAQGDTPAPIIYYLAPTTPDPGPDDGGSVILVVGAKLYHIFNGELDVRYFGARSENANNQTFIQNALNYIETNEGCSLSLPPDQILLVSTKLLVASSIVINGNNGTIKSNTISSDLIEFVASYNKVENLIVEGKYVSNQTGDLVFRQSNNNTITNCIFRSPSNAGILFEKSSGNFVQNCRFEDKSYGILLRDSFNNSITGNYFTRGRTRGVLNSSGYAVIPLGDGIKMSSGATTFDNLKGGYKTIISNNVFDNVWRDAVDMFTDGEDIVFSNNIVLKPEALGMDIKTIYRANPDDGTSIIDTRQTRNITISGNYFEDCGLTDSDSSAISIKHTEEREGELHSIEKGVHNITIVGNQFHRGKKTAIIIGYSQNVQINGNLFKDVPKENIHIYRESRHVVIADNIFDTSHSTSYPIYATQNENYKDISITGNILKNINASLYGIICYGKDIMICNNSISGFATSIYLDRAEDIQIMGNKLYDATTQAIRLASQNYTIKDVQIFNNKIRTSARGILYNSNTSDIISSGNVFKDCTAGTEININLVTNYQSFGNFTV